MADHHSYPSLARGRGLGRYEIISEIAKGGMGTVLLGRLAGAGGFQRLFAVKLLHVQYAMNAEFVEMLLDEARIAARLHHPNVVAIQEVSDDEEHGYFLVMDYVEGVALSDLLREGRSPGPSRWRIVHRVVLDALAGLEAAHTLADDDGTPLRVVHRDISPQNILVGVDGVSRVTDFGLAKAVARTSSTRVGQIKGKLAYMSPEQARGERIDLRTDVFATGVVLWESLTGQRLFKASTDQETYARVLREPIPSASSVAPSVPPELDAVCARALERDPSRRFASAHEMAQALERAARRHDLVADAHEVGAHVRAQFAQVISARRAAIRAAAPEGSGPRPSATPAPAAAPVSDGWDAPTVASGVVDEFDESRTGTVVYDGSVQHVDEPSEVVAMPLVQRARRVSQPEPAPRRHPASDDDAMGWGPEPAAPAHTSEPPDGTDRTLVAIAVVVALALSAVAVAAALILRAPPGAH